LKEAKTLGKRGRFSPRDTLSRLTHVRVPNMRPKKKQLSYKRLIAGAEGETPRGNQTSAAVTGKKKGGQVNGTALKEKKSVRTSRGRTTDLLVDVGMTLELKGKRKGAREKKIWPSTPQQKPNTTNTTPNTPIKPHKKNTPPPPPPHHKKKKENKTPTRPPRQKSINLEKETV